MGLTAQEKKWLNDAEFIAYRDFKTIPSWFHRLIPETEKLLTDEQYNFYQKTGKLPIEILEKLKAVKTEILNSIDEVKKEATVIEMPKIISVFAQMEQKAKQEEKQAEIKGKLIWTSVKMGYSLAKPMLISVLKSCAKSTLKVGFEALALYEFLKLFNIIK